jgi:uncharacterized protein (TIGR02996 family)
VKAFLAKRNFADGSVAQVLPPNDKDRIKWSAPMQPHPPLACWFGDPGFEPLVAAVIIRPWDSAPRLVLSDWLREHGDDIGATWAARPSFVAILAIIRLAHLRGLPPDELAEAFVEAGPDVVAGLAPAFRELGNGFRALASALETAHLIQMARATMAQRTAADNRRKSKPAASTTRRAKSRKRRG